MFDIEQKMEAIPDPKTRKLFEEVYSSYQHGNYRSAVVMLWSVVIADIIFKLKFLDDTYRNKKAINILKDIEDRQNTKPGNSEWEKDLLEKAYSELKFISLEELETLKYLHTQRNFSAHPVLTEDDLLLAPNKDVTRSLIRKAMEAILLKTPLLHSELVDYITEDLKENKERLGGYENIKPYIQQRYFPNISDEGAARIFKSFWRFIFDSRGKEEDNELINFYALVVFSEKYENLYIKEIKKLRSYYQVSSHTDHLLIFLRLFPQMYNVLDNSVKTLISSNVKTLSQFIICDFLSKNLEEHYGIVLSRLNSEELSISADDLKKCFEKAKEKGILNKFFNICIKIYSKSYNFTAADNNYYNYIAPYLKDYSLNDIVLLMKETNDKNQVCNRNQAYHDHKTVLKRFHELGGNIDLIADLEKWKSLNNSILKEQDNSSNSDTKE